MGAVLAMRYRYDHVKPLSVLTLVGCFQDFLLQGCLDIPALGLSPGCICRAPICKPKPHVRQPSRGPHSSKMLMKAAIHAPEQTTRPRKSLAFCCCCYCAYRLVCQHQHCKNHLPGGFSTGGAGSITDGPAACCFHQADGTLQTTACRSCAVDGLRSPRYIQQPTSTLQKLITTHRAQ